MTAWEFAVMALAIWRVSRMISLEDGPANCLLKARKLAVGISPWPGGLGDLIECPFCVSIWLSFAMGIWYLFWPVTAVLICIPFALSAVTVILQLVLPDREQDVLEE